MKRPPEPRYKVKDTKPVKHTYKAFKFERTLHLIYKTLDGIYGWEVESFTNNKDVWHPSIDTEGDQVVFCDCFDFIFKREPRSVGSSSYPSVWTPEYQCKHIKKGIITLKKASLLKEVPTPVLKEDN